MKIFICLRRHDAMRKARDWFTARSNYIVLEEITHWARGQERDWGECFLMMEVDVPGAADLNATNVDCIVAFSDRVAVIEVKNHRSYKAAQASLLKSLRQCCENFDLVSTHLAGVIHDKSVRPFLFFPQLTSNEIAQLTAQQLSSTSLRHATIGGGARCRERPSLPNGHPLYIPAALKSRVGAIQDSDARRFSRDAQAVLLGLTQPAERYEFSDLDRAVDHLQRHSGTPSVIRLGEGYIRGLRSAALEQVRERLQTRGVVEVIGAPGIGKSDFIREVLETIIDQDKRQLPIAVVDLKASYTSATFYRSLLGVFDQEPHDWEDEQSLLDRLLQERAVVWIQACDAAARPLVTRLVTVLLASRDDRRCRVIVESTASPLMTSDEDRVRLFPLSAPSIQRILRVEPPGHPDHLLPAHIASSRGNPRLAITRWKSARLNAVPDWLANDFAWLEHAFSDRHERALCSLVVSILDESPFELDVNVLFKAATAVFRNLLRSTVKAALIRVFSTLQTSQMLCLQTIRGSQSPALNEEHSSLELVRIGQLNASMSEYVLRQTDAQLLSTWRNQVTSFLERQERPARHVAVLLGLRRNDLGPWCGSAFRQGYMQLDQMVNWLDRRLLERQAISNDEYYIERALRVAHNLIDATHGRNDVVIANELPKPSGTARWSTYFHQLLTHVTSFWHGGLANLDLNICEGTEPDVAAEATCWSYSFSPENVSSSQWWPRLRLLVQDAHNLTPAVRLLVYHHTLMCAALCGESFVRQEAVRQFLRDICKEMGPLAVSEDHLYYLVSANTFYDALVDEERVGRGPSFARAYIKWCARAHDEAPGTPERTTLVFDDRFWAG